MKTIWYYIKTFFMVIDTRTTRKVWTIVFTNWNWKTSWFKSFWFKKNAMKYFEKHKINWIFIDIRNEITGKIEILKDDPRKIVAPTRYVSMQ